MREEWLPLLGNVSQSCISRQGAPVSFSQVIPSCFSWVLIGWFTCASVFLHYHIISQCVCSVFYSKSPWEARAFAVGVVRKISWLVLMFCSVSWGQAELIPVLFVSGVLPDPQLSCPLLCSRDIFQDWCMNSANSNRDLPVCPLSALTPAGVAFFTDSQHTGSWKLTDRQGGRV